MNKKKLNFKRIMLQHFEDHRNKRITIGSDDEYYNNIINNSPILIEQYSTIKTILNEVYKTQKKLSKQKNDNVQQQKKV